MEDAPASKKFWYLVCSKPRRERLAQAHLERQGFTTYLPLARQARRRAHRRITVVEPLFTRYLFIQLDTVNDNWSPIRSTIGVSTLVRFGMQPARVPESIIDNLQARESADGIHDLPGRSFRRGEKVRLGEGPMAGCEAIWLAGNGKERAHILLDIMGQKITATVDENTLEHSES